MTESQKQFEIRVFGTPAPKGSKTAFVRRGRAVVVEGSSASGRQKLASWSSEVAREACNERPSVPLQGPLRADITFYMPKPKSAPKGKVFCDKRPDLDKIVRSTYDSMTGIVFEDDAQIVVSTVQKLYASADEPPGAFITVCTVRN